MTVDLIYFVPNFIWSLTDSTTISVIQTFGTANGSNSPTVWYRAGTPNTVATTGSQKTGDPGIILAGDGLPADYTPRTDAVHKYVPHRTLKARSYILQDDWDRVKKEVRAAAGCINMDKWGDDERGTWLFTGPITSTTEPYADFPLLTIELNFLNDPKGFYPMGFYRDAYGSHPPDCATEIALCNGDPEETTGTNKPALNGVLGRNGICLISVQKEVAFTPLFKQIGSLGNIGTIDTVGFDPRGPLATQ